MFPLNKKTWLDLQRNNYKSLISKTKWREPPSIKQKLLCQSNRIAKKKNSFWKKLFSENYSNKKNHTNHGNIPADHQRLKKFASPSANQNFFQLRLRRGTEQLVLYGAEDGMSAKDQRSRWAWRKGRATGAGKELLFGSKREWLRGERGECHSVREETGIRAEGGNEVLRERWDFQQRNYSERCVVIGVTIEIGRNCKLQHTLRRCSIIFVK
jgi:hypothetical protein